MNTTDIFIPNSYDHNISKIIASCWVHASQ